MLQVGETVGVSQPLRIDTTDNRYVKAIATSAEGANATAITLFPGDDGDYVPCIVGGEYEVGATLVAGTPYCVSATSGLICPFADLVSTNYVTYLGVATSTLILSVDINVTGVAIA